MQLSLLSDLDKQLYPYQSEHQSDIESYFGNNTYRALSLQEKERLSVIDLFFVAFTNRCGSTLLTEVLYQASFKIPPRSEVFNSDSIKHTCAEYGIGSFTDYFMQLIEGWGEQDVLGFKIGPRQLFWLMRAGLLEHCRSVRIINAVRDDRVAQSISLFIAQHSGQWHSEMAPQNTEVEKLSYSRGAILNCLHHITLEQQKVEYFALIHQLPLLKVSYENILSDVDQQVLRISKFLEVTRKDILPISLDEVPIKQQRDEDSEAMLERFRQEFFFQGHGSETG